MGRKMRMYTKRNCFQKDKRAVSPAISVTIITAATIVMVLVSSSYAYSALHRQQSSSELQAMQKSFETFDDSIADVAWDRASARATHFTLDFGFLEVVGNVPITVSVREVPTVQYQDTTGYLRYNLSTSYLTFGDNYMVYFIGDDKSVIYNTHEVVGQGFISQKTNWVNIFLTYRVRVLVEPNSVGCAYVDIMVTKLEVPSDVSPQAGDFDLLAKNINISTAPHLIDASPSLPRSTNSYNIDVNLDGNQFSAPVNLNIPLTEPVVFNFLTSTVQVTV